MRLAVLGFVFEELFELGSHILAAIVGMAIAEHVDAS